MNKQRFAAWCCAAILLLCTLTPSNSVLARSWISGCSVPDPGKRIPVVFVHGLFGDPAMWGSKTNTSTMLGLVNELNALYVDDPFDYHRFNTQWVDNAHIGPALALRIACLAQASHVAGGPGKVIVIAHSMGGLATRFAANFVLPDGHKVSDDIGLVITIGTPNFGSLVADVGMMVLETLCQNAGLTIPFAGVLLTASPNLCDNILPAMTAMQTNIKAKLGSLPMLPQSIPLMGIAGDVHSQFGAFDTKITVSSNDTVVLVNSALVGSSQQNQGAGTSVFHCQALVPFFAWSDGNCAHGNLVSNAAVQLQVVKSIKLYLDALQPGLTPSVSPTQAVITPTPTVPPTQAVVTPTPTQAFDMKAVSQELDAYVSGPPQPVSPSQLKVGTVYDVQILIQNTGTMPLVYNTMGMSTANPRDRTSVFCYTAQPSYNCSRPNLAVGDPSFTVNPGDTAYISFLIQAPTTPGTYDEDYSLMYNGQWLNQPVIHWHFIVL